MRTVILTVFALFFAFSFTQEASAQIYKWVDKDGGVHFSNAPTSEGDKKPESVLSESSSKQKECVEPDTIVVGAQTVFSNHAWKKYDECIKDGGVKVLPWKKK